MKAFSDYLAAHPDADASASIFDTAIASRGRDAFHIALLFFVGLVAFNLTADWVIERFIAESWQGTWRLANACLLVAAAAVALHRFIGRGIAASLRDASGLRSLFEANGDAFFLVAPESGTFIDANPCGCAMLGLARAELIGATIGSVSSGESPYTHAAAMERLKAMASGEIQRFEWHCKAKGGRLFWAELTVRVVKLRARSLGLAVLRDVTARKEAERKAEEERRVLEALFQNTDSAILDLDLSPLFRWVESVRRQGVKDIRAYVAADEQRLKDLGCMVRINDMNRAALRLLETTAEDTCHREDNLCHCKNSIVLLDAAEAMFRRAVRLRQEAEIITATSTRVPVLQSLPVPRTEEEAKRVPVVIVDLRQVKLAEVARQASAAKSQFLASMSHEIRTPLNAVIGNLELLRLTSPSGEQAELIGQAEKAATSLLALIGNILDFSKIEQGKLALEMGDVNPGEIVTEAISVLKAGADKKELFIGAIFDPDMPEIVRCDAVRLRQILLNLVGNALKFTSDGGVLVAVGVADWDGDLCELKFSVHDSGRGFDQELAARLFMPFVQDKVAIERSEGTGLGLSISRSLVEALGGTIGCESVPGEGATFWFKLPLKTVKRASLQRSIDLTGHKVAVLGGNTPGAVLFVRYFSARGASIVRAPNPASAIAALQPTAGDTLAPHSVLMVSTIDLVTGMAQDLRENRIVPLLYGSDGSPGAVRRALRAGFSAGFSVAEGPRLLDRNIQTLLGPARTAAFHEEPSERTEELHPHVKSKRILVLEDRLVNQLIIGKQLTKLGVTHQIATDGVEGLAALNAQTFDLVLCDCLMPNMNGYDFARAVRGREKADDANRHLPIVALTANAFREDVESCHLAGMDDFLSKPLRLERLAHILNKWLGCAAANGDDERTPTQEDPAVDLDVLGEVLAPGESEVLANILSEFAYSMAKSYGTLQSALANGRVNGVQVAAHGAKGEARSAGAMGLGDIYAEVEREAKNGNLEAAKSASGKLPAELNRVQLFIAEHLKNANEESNAQARARATA